MHSILGKGHNPVETEKWRVETAEKLSQKQTKEKETWDIEYVTLLQKFYNLLLHKIPGKNPCEKDLEYEIELKK